ELLERASALTRLNLHAEHVKQRLRLAAANGLRLDLDDLALCPKFFVRLLTRLRLRFLGPPRLLLRFLRLDLLFAFDDGRTRRWRRGGWLCPRLLPNLTLLDPRSGARRVGDGRGRRGGRC